MLPIVLPSRLKQSVMIGCRETRECRQVPVRSWQSSHGYAGHRWSTTVLDCDCGNTTEQSRSLLCTTQPHITCSSKVVCMWRYWNTKVSKEFCISVQLTCMRWRSNTHSVELGYIACYWSEIVQFSMWATYTYYCTDIPGWGPLPGKSRTYMLQALLVCLLTSLTDVFLL